MMNSIPVTKNSRQSVKKRIPTKTLPKERGPLSGFLTTVAGVAAFSASLVIADGNLSLLDKLLVNLSVILAGLCLVELTHRIFLATEEYRHLVARYDDSIVNFLVDVFHLSSSLKVALVTSAFANVVVLLRHHPYPWVLWCDLGPAAVMTSLIGALLLSRVFSLSSGPLSDSLWISNSNGVDYGSGMAHSFFHGYIKLVIPKTGDSEKHLEELMQIYEAREKIQLECYKLFILIPKSLYCPPSLMDISPSINESKSLDEKQITVAGVQKRIYKNAVYKIKSGKGKSPTYVVAEYATPVKTFKDVFAHTGEHSNAYKKHKNEIVLQFYLTLKKILKEYESCTDYCELIYYDDKDENGCYYDVGEVLLAKLEEVKKRVRNAGLPLKVKQF